MQGVAMTQSNLWWGIRAGLIIAGLYSLFAILLYAATGPARFEHNGTTLPSVIAGYFSGGIIGGAVIGLCRGLLAERRTAIPVAIFAALPAAAGITILLSGKVGGWTGEQWFMTIGGAFFIGISGVQVFSDDR
jgi:hypothetical protein